MTLIKHNVLDKLKIEFVSHVPKRVIGLFQAAINIIARAGAPNKPVKVIFARGSFPIRFSDDHIGIYIRNLIAYDVDKLEKIKHDELLMAALLEELVHIYFDIDDEVKVGKKVAELYPRVKFDEKRCQYVIRSPSQT